MLDVAARATKGIKLPTRKATRNAIVRAFHENIKALREELSVSFFPSPCIMLNADLTER